MKHVKLGIGAAAALALIATGFGATSAAIAEPASEPVPAGSVIAVGSNTTEALYDAYEAAGLDGIVSYHATGSATINPTGSNPFDRPNGSGDGRKALSSAWSTSQWHSTDLNNDDVTVARSSSRNGNTKYNASSPNDLIFIPLARDAVGVAVKGVPSLSNSANILTTASLQAIYGAGTHTNGLNGDGTHVGDVTITGSDHQVTVSASPLTKVTVHPKLPQTGSGTRSFFLGALGSTTFGSWVTDNAGEENTASVLTTTGDVIPFSGASVVAQSNGNAPSTGGFSGVTFPEINGQTLATGVGTSSAAAGALYGSTSTVPTGGAGDFTRDVYTVVPNSQLSTVYSGKSLQTIASVDLPDAQNDDTGAFLVADYGFEHLTSAYINTNKANTWYQGPFES